MEAPIDLAKLLESRPQFHRLADIHAGLSDEMTSWAAQLGVLRHMQSYLRPGMSTLETGCGYSTVMFAAAGTEHYCITPAAAETERVKEFCQSKGIDTDRLHFLIGDSREIAPRLDRELLWDLVFIDGGHFFPVPCIDWQYTEQNLRIGGWMVIDDLRIPTVRMLYDFLKAESVWKEDAIVGDTVFFVKTGDSTNLNDWLQQPYNRSYPDWSYLPWNSRWKHTRAAGLLTRAVGRGKRLLLGKR